jgi:hypothetical protein
MTSDNTNQQENKAPLPELAVHKIAKLFPLLPDKEMKELREDIDANGIVVPILVNKAEDTILDGRNRYTIARQLKLTKAEVPLEPFKGEDEDIPAEILSRNIFRRHLTDDQRITLLAKVLGPKYEAEATVRKKGKQFGGKAPNESPSKTPVPVNSTEPGEVAQKLAKIGKVSDHKARQAMKVNKAGFAQEVIEGKTKLGKAAKKAGTKRRTAPKVKTFEDEVWAKYQTWMKRTWDITQHRRVRGILRGFLDNPTDKPDKK